MPVPESALLRSPYATGSLIAEQRASSSRAAAASAARFLLALTASTRKRLRSRLSKSIVLAPIEPVAPRSVTVRSAGARSNAARKISGFITHQTNRHRPAPRRLPEGGRFATQRLCRYMYHYAHRSYRPLSDGVL